jgi:hypothetical protein
MSPLPLGILASSAAQSTEWDLLIDYTVPSPTTSITLSNIEPIYERLEIWLTGRNQSGVTPIDYFIRPNNISSNIYNYLAVSRTSTWSPLTNQSAILAGAIGSDDTWIGDVSSITTIDGAFGSAMKTWQSRNTQTDSFNGIDRAYHTFGSMQSSTDITSLTIFTSNNFNTGLKITVFGVKS